MSRRLENGAAAAVLAGTATFYVIAVLWRRAASQQIYPNFDHYTYFYPNLFYTWRALRQGWGFLWNPYQNCGQPHFAVSGVGSLYPLHWVSLIVGLDVGQFVEVGLHLLVAGLGAYWLARELGLGVPAALAAAATFELGGTTIQLAAWVPQNIGAYVWMPAMMAASERALRRPNGRAAILLGLVTAVQILPGYPQINLFTYQIVALRTLWFLVVDRPARPVRSAVAVAAGLGLGPLLAAVQLVPSLELAGESLRGRALSLEEIRPGGALTLTWAEFRRAFGERPVGGTLITAVGIALAGCAVTGTRTRRTALFFLALAVLYALLAFDTPVFDLYRRMPFGARFRLPHRALWVTGFAASPLVGLGVEALLAARARTPLRRLVAIAAGGVAVLAFALFSPTGLTGEEAILLAITAAVAAVGVFVPRGAWAGALALPVLVWTASYRNVDTVSSGPLISAAALFQEGPAFDWLKSRMTLQQRIYQFSEPRNYSVMPKSASLFGIRSVTDYETQAARRYAALHVALLTNRPMASINDFYFKNEVQLANRPLLNLLGTRYVVLAGRGRPAAPAAGPLWPLRKIGISRIYENAQALPRAFFVPRVAVVARPREVLARIMSARNDPRAVAWVEAPPPDGFLGALLEGTPPADVTIEEDRGEIVVVSVDAPAEGFLFLSDQYYPGWEATVDGTPAAILRANYAFRAVHVPHGPSVVVFRYRPASLRFGAAASAVSVVCVGIFLFATRRRRENRSETKRENG